jgi:hypothetical protein
MEKISPELVLVDPELRARLADLPSGPTLPPFVFVADEHPPGPNSLFARVAAGAAAFLVFLALPLLAVASDLVRRQPQFAPAHTTRSGLVHVGAKQHVRADLLRAETGQLRSGR